MHVTDVPMSMESEQGVLGSILLEPHSFYNVSSLIKSDDFFIERHQFIWDAIQRLIENNLSVDLLTVSKELASARKLNDIGGEAYLTSLVNQTPTHIHASAYAEIVYRAAVRRRLLQASDVVRITALDESIPIADVINESESAIFSVNADRQTDELVELEVALSDYYDRLEEIRDKGVPLGTPTGFVDVDAMMGGMQKSDLVIFAGRTGMGKTSWLLSATLNMAQKGVGIAMFTMEMSVEQIAQRMIAMESGVTVSKLRAAKLNDGEMIRLVKALGSISQLPVFIDDTPSLTPNDILMRCRRLKNEHDLSLVIVDYMQFMNAGPNFKRSLREEISYISRKLKEIARELEVTMLVASQLNREVEKRQDKRPMLSDLRESGSIEQDADAVLFLYRDAYYNPGTEFPSMVEINLAKYRHGPTGKAILYFDEETTRFRNAATYLPEYQSANTNNL